MGDSIKYQKRISIENISEKEKKILYNEFSPNVKTWLLKNDVSEYICGEVINDVFLNFFKKYDSDKYTILSFLYLATQSHISRINRSKKYNFLEIPEKFDIEDDFEANLENEEMWTSRINNLYKEIRELPLKEKDIAISYFINRESMKDIAYFQNLNLNTVKSRIQKSKKRLRNKDLYCNVDLGFDNIIKESKKTLKNKSFVFKIINIKKIKQRYKNLEKSNKRVKSIFYLRINDQKGALSTKHLYDNYGDDEFKFTIYMGDTIEKYGHTFNLNYSNKRLQLLIDNKIEYYWYSTSMLNKSGLHRDNFYHCLENNNVRVSFKHSGKKDHGTIIEFLK